MWPLDFRGVKVPTFSEALFHATGKIGHELNWLNWHVNSKNIEIGTKTCLPGKTHNSTTKVADTPTHHLCSFAGAYHWMVADLGRHCVVRVVALWTLEVCHGNPPLPAFVGGYNPCLGGVWNLHFLHGCFCGSKKHATEKTHPIEKENHLNHPPPFLGSNVSFPVCRFWWFVCFFGYPNRRFVKMFFSKSSYINNGKKHENGFIQPSSNWNYILR